MPVTIRVNGTSLSLVHKFSNGFTQASIPDVCKTPSPGGPVPVPYPNFAQSVALSNGTTTVKGDKAMAANKGSKFSVSNGDNAGTAGGVKSSTFMKEATWILYSFDVKMDGKNTARLTDKMFHNAENAANLGGEGQGGAGGDGDDDDDKYAEYEEEFEEDERPRGGRQRGNVSGNNAVQNREFEAALREAGRRTGVDVTDRGIRQMAHQAISKQGIGGAGRFNELVDAIIAVIAR